jgi:hydroxymethylglutaryl-CoA synthase
MSAGMNLGISGMSAYVPPYRVSLKDWCSWTSSSWDKTRSVVGTGFRMPGPLDSVYTMAANAALKLILDHDVDPQRVGFLAVGTESGTDNATSAAVVVRGMLDQALAARGLPTLSRQIEAPEFKQACLGGLYGLKGGLRYLGLDGAGRQALVVAADVAEYAQNSSGEPTQGAGAVAMLLEESPKLLEVDLRSSASASAYRALDFRKPFARYCGQDLGADGRPRDFPVFNGKYSTACYTDATLASLGTYFGRQVQGSRSAYIRELGAVFMHRPYRRMPATAWAWAYLAALFADGESARSELQSLCATAGVALDEVQQEMEASPRLLERALAGDLVSEIWPLTHRLTQAFRASPKHRQVVDDKMTLGQDVAAELGNLYAAALPAWLAAGLEEAALTGTPLDGRDLLLVGYGSGDASEVLRARVAPGWHAAAARTRMEAVLEGAVDLDQAQYRALHSGTAQAQLLPEIQRSGFTVSHRGRQNDPQMQDLGVEYYAYSAGAPP